MLDLIFLIILTPFVLVITYLFWGMAREQHLEVLQKWEAYRENKIRKEIDRANQEF